MLLDSLAAKKGIIFLVAVQVLFSHPTMDLEDMVPPYLKAGKRTLMHAKDIESKLDEVLQTILTRNANFIRQHSGMVLEDILTLQLKVVEYLPLNGRAYR